MKIVKDVLKRKNQKEVWSVSPKATVFEALALMGDKSIGALMVIDENGKVVGIVSERDYARKIVLKGKASRETAVKEIMTPADQMYTVKPETSVDEAMVLITGKHIRHVPVFDNGQFVGIISIGDLVKSIIEEQETLIEQLSDYIAGKYTG
ncbi:MAG TPA: CBS domain-containing protein [Syntrophorhabdaceae bacterium]|nr:CBS domain-containing protein [Syntrophorhabdaceae bacterium]